jgi:hypothetical protein
MWALLAQERINAYVPGFGLMGIALESYYFRDGMEVQADPACREHLIVKQKE